MVLRCCASGREMRSRPHSLTCRSTGPARLSKDGGEEHENALDRISSSSQNGLNRLPTGERQWEAVVEVCVHEYVGDTMGLAAQVHTPQGCLHRPVSSQSYSSRCPSSTGRRRLPGVSGNREACPDQCL